MKELGDHELLGAHVRGHSETAFATLVGRYVNLVHSAAVRFTGNPDHAADITQAVFIILAQKAGSLSRNVVLSGWLYETARLTAANFMKREIRRQKREQEACMQSNLNEPEESVWPQISPLLDEAMGHLGECDRNAVVLRYFEKKSTVEIAVALRMREDAAYKRINRALAKLRKFFTARGVTISAAALAGAVSENSVQAAPAGLTGIISKVALAKGAAAGGSTFTLVKGALKVMTWTKANTVAATSAILLLAAGTTAISVKEYDVHRIYDWQKSWDFSMVDKVPPQTTLRPAPASRSRTVDSWAMWNGKAMGLGNSVPEMLQAIYFIDPQRLIYNIRVPEGTYDFLSNPPDDAFGALKRKFQSNLGLMVRRTLVETNAQILIVQNPHAPGIKPATAPEKGTLWHVNGSFTATHMDGMWVLVQYLESNLGVIIVDRTQLPRDLDVVLKWDGTPDGLKEALQEQLGLRLEDSDQPVPVIMGVVDKVVPAVTFNQSAVANIEQDGSVHYRVTLEGINRSGATMTEVFIGGLTNCDRITDASGRPMVFSLQEDGTPFLVVKFNEPVPSGGKYQFNFESTFTKFCAPTTEPGGFTYTDASVPSNEAATHSQEEYHLPPGAILVAKQPEALKQTVDNGQITLRIDRMIQPDGVRQTDFQYQLAEAK